MAELADEQVAQVVQAGDREAFGVLIDRYQAKLLRYGRRFLARHEDIEDMVQDVFIRAYTNIQSYDATQPFSPWMYRIAHNTFVNELKKQSRTPWHVFDADTVFPTLASVETADRASLQTELAAEIETCLGTLKEKYRAPLTLFYYEELSYKEIGEVLQIPVTTVGVRINRARQLLAKAYNQTVV